MGPTLLVGVGVQNQSPKAAMRRYIDRCELNVDVKWPWITQNPVLAVTQRSLRPHLGLGCRV